MVVDAADIGQISGPGRSDVEREGIEFWGRGLQMARQPATLVAGFELHGISL